MQNCLNRLGKVSHGGVILAEGLKLMSMDNSQQTYNGQPSNQQSPMEVPSQPVGAGAYSQNRSQQQGYAQQPNYGQAQPTYTQPQQPQPNYGQPQPNYGQPQPNYGQPQPNYGQAQPNYGQPGPNPYAQNGQYGQYRQQPIPVYASKSKVAAGILGILLGAFGAHNFYLGFYGKAAAQLALTVLLGWVFGLGALAAEIWGLIEGVLILSSHYGSKWHRDARGVELSD